MTPRVNAVIHWAGAGTHECVAFLVTGLSYGTETPYIEGVIYDDDPHPARFSGDRWHYPNDCPERGKIAISYPAKVVSDSQNT